MNEWWMNDKWMMKEGRRMRMNEWGMMIEWRKDEWMMNEWWMNDEWMMNEWWMNDE